MQDNNPTSREEWIAKIKADYDAACEHMDPDKLTQEQGFAVGLHAGVPGVCLQGDARLLYSCAITVVDWKWAVKPIQIQFVQPPLMPPKELIDGSLN